MKYDTQRPYLACYVIVRKNGKIAFVLRTNTAWMNGHYSLPSGKTERGEASSAGAAREGLEEIGITIDPQKLRFVHFMHRHNDDEELDWADVYFEIDDYEGNPHNAEPHMHGELAWLDPKNLPANVIVSVRVALEAIEAGQMYSELGFES